MFDQLMENFIIEYRKSPRNKIYINEELLIASVEEETGEKISTKDLRKIIKKYIDGDLNEQQEQVYDAAVYSCGVAARSCLGNDPEEDIDYELDWISNSDDSYTAEVRLC